MDFRDGIQQKKQRSTHVHHPAGAFDFNTSGTFAATEAEYERMYQSEFELLGPPRRLGSPTQAHDHPQVAGLQDLSGSTSKQIPSATGQKRRQFRRSV